jgi:hypothetical protein
VTEPDVTLSDYALALECALFAWLLHRRRGPGAGIRRGFLLFFVALSVASALGGTVHGFFLEEDTRGQRLLWRATLLAIGVAALCGWRIGAMLHFSQRGVLLVTIAALLQLIVYATIVLAITQEFWLAIAQYLPAALFVLLALALAYWREPLPALALAVLGLALTLVAPLVQQLGIGLHPVYLTHNTLYHAIQGAALFLIFLGARALVAVGTPAERGRSAP